MPPIGAIRAGTAAAPLAHHSRAAPNESPSRRHSARRYRVKRRDRNSLRCPPTAGEAARGGRPRRQGERAGTEGERGRTYRCQPQPGEPRTAGRKRRRLLRAEEGERARGQPGSSTAPPLRRAAETCSAREGGGTQHVRQQTAARTPPPPVPPRPSTHIFCAAAAPTPAPHHVTRSPIRGFESRPPRSPQPRTRESGSAPRRESAAVR